MVQAKCLILLGLAAVLTLGCETADRTDQQRARDSIAHTDLWPFWPTTMRIHPLTRVARDDETGHPVVEVRVEFADPQGIASRASGTLTIELFDQTARGAAAINVWNRNLTDPVTNTRHFDDVTRTYLLRLQIDPDRLPTHIALQAHFIADNEAKMSDSYELRVPAALLER